MTSLINPNYKLDSFTEYKTEKETNDALKQSFIEAGDDGTQPRDVRYFIFKNEENDNAISAFRMKKLMLPYGFKFEPIDEPYGLKMSHDREIASSEFDDFNEELKAIAEANGWVCTGWEAQILGHPNDIVRASHIERAENSMGEYIADMLKSAFQEKPKEGLQDLISDLLLNGDNGVHQRVVSHCFKKLSEENSSTQDFGDALKCFSSIVIFTFKGPDGAERIFFRHFCEIATHTFDGIVAEMAMMAENHGWEYEAIYSDVILPSKGSNLQH